MQDSEDEAVVESPFSTPFAVSIECAEHMLFSVSRTLALPPGMTCLQFGGDSEPSQLWQRKQGSKNSSSFIDLVLGLEMDVPPWCAGSGPRAALSCPVAHFVPPPT